MEEKVELTEAEKQELDRRLRAREENPDDGVSWEELRERLLASR